MWVRQAVGLSFLAGCITGEKVDPVKLIPEPLRPPEPDAPPAERDETRQALALLELGLRQLAS